MALDKIMPDDMNEVICALLAYISEGDKAAGAKMSYGDFGKHLAQEYGKRWEGGNPNGCFISGTPTKVKIETSERTKYELTWNKIAKFIHPYLKSTAVSETGEETMQRMNETTKITDTKLTASTKAAIKEHFPYAVTLGDLKQCISDDPTTLDYFTPRTVDIIMNILDFNDYDSPAVKQDTPTDTAAFDYSAVDDDTAQYLRKATARIANSYADIGAVLAEAQERLANNYHGIFEKWYTSIGMKRDTVYGFIRIHNFRNDLMMSSEFRRTSENALEIFDNLPKTLQADISSPSAPAEAVNAVLSGDITTHKDFIAMKKQLEETQEENERLTEKNRFLSMDYTHEKERNERMLDELKEFREKKDALEVELRQAQSEAREVIVTDPTESEEYKAILDERNKMHRQIIATTQENDRLKEKQSEMLKKYNELMTRQPIVTGGIVTGGYDPEQLKEFFEDYYEAAHKAVRAVYIFVREDYPQEIKNYVRNRVNDLRNYIEDLEDIHEDDF